MGGPLEVRVGGKQHLPTPDLSIGPIPRAIKGQTNHPTVCQAVIGHAGSYVRVVVLDGDAWQLRLLFSIPSGEIAGMHVVSDPFRLHTE
jgi:hypothetical protein